MGRRFYITLFVFFIAVSGLHAQQTIKTLKLSTVDFSNFPGTPRVVRDESKNVWLVVWRQQGSPSKLIGRIVKPDGGLNPPKVLATGVSAVDQNFDVVYNPDHFTYLLAQETSQGLQVQLFNASLVKQGSPSLIEGGVSGTIPRLVYDTVGKKFLIFWLAGQDGVTRKVLKDRPLDSTGKPTAEARTLSTAASGRTFGSLEVSRNQKNGNLLAMTALMTGTTSEAVLGYNVKADGSLLRSTPLSFQANTTGLKTSASASFVDAGTGFGFWSDRTSVKYRKVSATGGFASPTKQIANSADVNSIQASLILGNNEFIGMWTRSNQLQAVTLNATSGAVVKQPFAVASSELSHNRNARGAYDSVQKRILAVWEDSTVDASTVSGAAAKFRIRGAVFSVDAGGEEVAVQIQDNAFNPRSITISAGTTVKWTNFGSNPHTVTDTTTPTGGTVFDSGTLNPGAEFRFKFNQQGNFPYVCLIHSGMTASVTVQ